MIIDKLTNAHLYYYLNPNLKKGLEYLETTDLLNTPDGKHIIEGKEVFANVQSGKTKDPKTTPWEAHKIYTDIQYIIKGTEIMGWANLDELQPSSNYSEEKDITFGRAKGSYFTVPEGYFVIFTPQDAHQPMLQLDKPDNVKKVIVKVKY